MGTELSQDVSFEQAIDEVGALYENTKDQLRTALFALNDSERNKAIDIAMANNAKMRDYACVALQKAYGINI